jgi:hypothetical protein
MSINDNSTGDVLNRDFNTISPSAKSLLLMKGHTNIPFVRETAELAISPEPYVPDFEKTDFSFWLRVVHFESRYWSIDQLLEGLPATNILELASGFSFRGLDVTAKRNAYYIDTDLPDLVTIKSKFLSKLQPEPPNQKGKLELLSLNALVETEVDDIINRFPEGELVIVNEGLLMYLNDAEKEKLCSIIRKVLHKRGGYWITADIYVKNQIDQLNIKVSEHTRKFFDKHNIEANKFDSFAAAESFFNRMGFVIDKAAETDRSKISSMKYLLKNAPPEKLLELRNRGKVQKTWRLKVAPLS